MSKKKKKYFIKINGDTMTSVVMFSLFFCAAVVVWGLWQSTKGVDCSAIIDSALRVFGTELGICGIMTIFKRWTDAQDKRAEARRKSRGGNKNENE